MQSAISNLRYTIPMAIFEIIFPVFAIAFVGYLTAYSKILTIDDIAGLSRFVFAILLPVLLFNSTASMELPDQVNWGFMISYYLVVLIIYALGVIAQKYWFLGSLKDQGIFGMGAAYSNLVLVGLPIISAGFGDQALLPLFMIVSIHSAVQFSIATIFVERSNRIGHGGRSRALKQTLKSLARNPIILSLLLGLGFNLTGLSLPQLLGDTLSLLSKATLPCALFVLGASLNQYKISGHLAEAGTIITLKMLLQPFLVWVMAFHVFHLDPLWGGVAVIAAGMPVGINTFLFAQKYQSGIATLSTAILLSTLLAVFSQSLLLAIFI